MQSSKATSSTSKPLVTVKAAVPKCSSVSKENVPKSSVTGRRSSTTTTNGVITKETSSSSSVKKSTLSGQKSMNENRTTTKPTTATPGDCKPPLTVSTKWKNLKNVEEQERAAKNERTLLESHYLVLIMIRNKTEAAIRQQRAEGQQMLTRLARLVMSRRQRRLHLCQQIDERRGWANVAQTTERQAQELKEIHLDQLMQSLQIICQEMEHKNTTLPVEHLHNAEHMNDILTKITEDGSKQEQQNALSDVCQAQKEMQTQFDQILGLLNQSQQFTDKLVRMLDVQQQIMITTTKPKVILS